MTGLSLGGRFGDWLLTANFLMDRSSGGSTPRPEIPLQSEPPTLEGYPLERSLSVKGACPSPLIEKFRYTHPGRRPLPQSDPLGTIRLFIGKRGGPPNLSIDCAVEGALGQ